MRSTVETVRRPLPGYAPPALPLRERRGPAWRPWITLLLVALAVKATIVGAGLAQAAGGHPLATLETQWRQWDAQHYLFLAIHGYVTTGDERNFIAFFPLYPALIAGLGHLGVPIALAPLILSNLGSLAATILLFEIARRDLDPGAAWRAAALWNAFPTAYFLFNGYTEGIFCALAFGCVLAARRGYWLGAGTLGALAALTRLTGIALLPLLLLELYAARGARRRILASGAWARWATPRAVLAPALVPLGLLAYLGINWRVLGHPFAFVEIQRARWYHQFSGPWEGALEAARGIFTRTPGERLTVGALELWAGLSAYLVSALSWLKLRPGDAIYATTVTALVTFLPFWLSIPRYLLALYPLFLLAGRVRNPFLQGLGVALSLVGLIVFSVAFTRGMWAF